MPRNGTGIFRPVQHTGKGCQYCSPGGGTGLPPVPEATDLGGGDWLLMASYSLLCCCQISKEEQSKMSARKLAVQFLTCQSNRTGTELFQSAAGQCPVPVPAGRTGQAALCLSVLRRDRTAYYIGCGAFALQQAAPAEAGQHRAEHSPSGHLPASLLRPDPQPCSSQ